MFSRKHLAAACLLTLAIATLVTVDAPRAADAPTAKAYIVGEVDVKDADAYKTYAAQTPAIIRKYGGVYLARGGQTVPLEGAAPAGRVVVIEFPSLEAARAFQSSPEYTAIVSIRHKAATSRTFIVQGLAGGG
jgi:uncharacterized protein (DUF1330 family)